MDNSGTESNNAKYENQISEIIQGELIDLHGPNGYKSIIETMVKISGKTEKEIITNYELFAELIYEIFGKLGNSQFLETIRLEIDKIGVENIHQDKKPIPKKHMRILIAEDDLDILKLYRVFLEAKGKEVTLTTDGRKCVEAYKRKK